MGANEGGTRCAKSLVSRTVEFRARNTLCWQA
jgi:hypothetical protein